MTAVLLVEEANEKFQTQLCWIIEIWLYAEWWKMSTYALCLWGWWIFVHCPNVTKPLYPLKCQACMSKVMTVVCRWCRQSAATLFIQKLSWNYISIYFIRRNIVGVYGDQTFARLASKILENSKLLQVCKAWFFFPSAMLNWSKLDGVEIMDISNIYIRASLWFFTHKNPLKSSFARTNYGMAFTT